ncbi:hypothetical protein ElyMa_001859800 [Elysia marginata]|uniref:Complex I assembly factor TIMMDC1, mitochondrial n=1 Tax=Elysia marginata TaxID=1093978 RepID=A0AAV4ENE9_9GAST|nr:hypothetical protein ElyMa_001859800 [Elysia marginata]
MSKFKEHSIEKDSACTTSIQRSNRIIELWTNVAHKVGIVAKCSTSHSFHGLNELEKNSEGVAGLQEDNDNDWDNELPGLQRRQKNKATNSRNSVASDMQVNQMIEQETGSQRLQAMYALGPDWMFIQEDTRTITTMFYRSVLLGFLLNVVKAAQTESKSSKNLSASQAAMKKGIYSKADSSKILKEAAKGTLRLTAFAGSLLYLSQSIAAYRNKSSLWEYSISTAVAVASVSFGKPPASFLLAVSGGALAGALGGSLVCSMMSSAGASQEQRTLNRIQQKLQQQQQKLNFDL